MRIILFVILVSFIAGLIFTLFSRPIRRAKNALVTRINKSFEDNEEETEKDDSKSS